MQPRSQCGRSVGRCRGVGCGLGVTLGAVGVDVTVGVGAGDGEHGGPCPWHQVMLTVSTRQPSLEPLVSLAIRQRSMPLFGA
jgi:hypothetical protein